MRRESFNLERVLKDNPRLTILEKEMAELFTENKVFLNPGLTGEGKLERFCSNVKVLRLKQRAYLSLLSTLVRLEMETIISEYE